MRSSVHVLSFSHQRNMGWDVALSLERQYLHSFMRTYHVATSLEHNISYHIMQTWLFHFVTYQLPLVPAPSLTTNGQFAGTVADLSVGFNCQSYCSTNSSKSWLGNPWHLMQETLDSWNLQKKIMSLIFWLRVVWSLTCSWIMISWYFNNRRLGFWKVWWVLLQKVN